MIYKALKPGCPGDHLWVCATTEMNGNSWPAQPLLLNLSPATAVPASQPADIPSAFWARYAFEWTLVEANMQSEKCGIWAVLVFWVESKRNVGE